MTVGPCREDVVSVEIGDNIPLEMPLERGCSRVDRQMNVMVVRRCEAGQR